MFTIIESYAHAIIQCECGEALSLSGIEESCEGCGRKYRISIRIEDVAEIDTVSEEQEWYWYVEP